MTQGQWVTIMVVMTTINIFMYIGLGTQGSFLVQGDYLDQFMTMDLNKTEAALLDTGANQNFALSTNLSRSPTFSPLSTIPGISVVAAFLDGLQIVIPFILTMFNIIFAPVTLMMYGGAPFFVSILMIPLVVLYIASLFQFIRGAS